ncbi:hypothetical protein [Amycolatopsis sp. PS_44_ISF1]|uniref:hypothetical protein n=1 Tax=Amycolatopsis sp. PS_44_ISF1 TaxID=2974917 RepID=UPI0028DF8191|nr:hypothetical protein [Amycolatopsis sp. PS_44_ISF1]MDT8916026.1 hypothetical protein [Amycolatopsis sp. PS_44_ISF1]
MWMVLDADGLLYAIDNRLYPGVSLNNADIVARKLLAPLVTEVRETRTARHHRQKYATEEYDLTAKPVLGGRDGPLIAITAGYVSAGQALPDAPLIATWEWQEPEPGDGGTMKHWWGEDAPRLYGVAPPSSQWHGGPSGRDPYRFIDSILSDGSRVATTAVIQDYRKSLIGTPLIRFMEQRHATTGELQGIRAVGRKIADRRYAGFSMRVDTEDLRRALHSPLMRQLGAYAALVTDPLIIVDAVHDAVVMTSDDYPAKEVPVPDTSKIAEMLEPADVDPVLALLREAASQPAQRLRTVDATFQRRDGSSWKVRLHAVGISVDTHPDGQFVMCRITNL